MTQKSWLDRLGKVTSERAEAVSRARETDSAWRDSISAALMQGVSAADVAEACGISRARVYQIRDGRR